MTRPALHHLIIPSLPGCGRPTSAQGHLDFVTRAPDMASSFVWGQQWSLTSCRRIRSVPAKRVSYRLIRLPRHHWSHPPRDRWRMRLNRVSLSRGVLAMPIAVISGLPGTCRSPYADRLAPTVPDLRRRRQNDDAVRANLAYKWKVSLRDLTAKVPGATAGFRPGDRAPGVPTRCNMSHESQLSVPPETEWDD
jgi:hypothetical protein